MGWTTENKQPDERAAFEAFLRDKKFPVLPVWRRGRPFQNYALENMWDAWQARATIQQANKGDEAAATLIAIGRLLSEAGFAPEMRIIDAVRDVIDKARAAAPQAVTLSDACIDALVRSSCHSDPVTKDGEYCLTVDEVRALLAARAAAQQANEKDYARGHCDGWNECLEQQAVTLSDEQIVQAWKSACTRNDVGDNHECAIAMVRALLAAHETNSGL